MPKVRSQVDGEVLTSWHWFAAPPGPTEEAPVATAETVQIPLPEPPETFTTAEVDVVFVNVMLTDACAARRIVTVAVAVPTLPALSAAITQVPAVA